MKYFLHDTNAFQDEKITELYIQFGYEGVGLFFTILEKIALQEKPVKTVVLKKQLHVGKKLEKCWKLMESLELIYSNNGETFNENILKFSEKYQIKKEKNKERVSQWRKNQEDTKNVTRYERVSNARKDNISKVKESKVKNTSLHQSVIAAFCEYYESRFKTSYVVAGGKDGTAIKQLLAKIKIKTTEAGLEPTDENIFTGFKHYLESIKDEWVLANLSIALINSKFNELFKNAKNGTATSSKSDHSDYLKFKHAREHAGNSIHS